MTNRPVNFNDPTEHAQSSDDQIKDRDGKCDSNDNACNDLDTRIKSKKNPCRTDPGLCGGTVYNLHGLDDPIYFWDHPEQYDGKILASWDGVKQIDPEQWYGLLNWVGSTINRDGTLGWFDTPLFNGESRILGSDARNGTACIPGGKCYNRTELNYIGEGEALAAMGFSKEDTHKIVWTWKNAKNIGWCALGVDCKFREPSQGTYEMTDVGWEFYNKNYSQSDPYPPSYPPRP